MYKQQKQTKLFFEKDARNWQTKSDINKNKVIINLNPSNPPVNMMNSIFFECKRINLKKIRIASSVLKKINKTIKRYIPGYNAKLFYQNNENFFH